MSYDTYKRSKRKPYTKAKAVDSTCRNHGSDPSSWSNRMHHNNKRLLAAEYELKEYHDR